MKPEEFATLSEGVSAGFPGEQAGASLKHGTSENLRARRASFPGEQAGASLKRAN